MAASEDEPDRQQTEHNGDQCSLHHQPAVQQKTAHPDLQTSQSLETRNIMKKAIRLNIRLRTDS